MILGLHGRLQAGKDTTADRIEMYSSLPVVRVSFADPLKDSAAALLGITREELELMKVDPGVSISVRVPLDTFRYRTVGLSGREYLQRYGTEAHRDVFGANFWCDQALSKCTDPNVMYVITDVRFLNEAEGILTYKAPGEQYVDGYLAHVVGPEGKGAGDHVSEQALDVEFDFEIDNSVRGDDFRSLDHHVRNMLRELEVLA